MSCCGLWVFSSSEIWSPRQRQERSSAYSLHPSHWSPLQETSSAVLLAGLRNTISHPQWKFIWNDHLTIRTSRAKLAEAVCCVSVDQLTGNGESNSIRHALDNLYWGWSRGLPQQKVVVYPKIWRLHFIFFQLYVFGMQLQQHGLFGKDKSSLFVTVFINR